MKPVFTLLMAVLVLSTFGLTGCTSTDQPVGIVDESMDGCQLQYVGDELETNPTLSDIAFVEVECYPPEYDFTDPGYMLPPLRDDTIWNWIDDIPMFEGPDDDILATMIDSPDDTGTGDFAIGMCKEYAEIDSIGMGIQGGGTRYIVRDGNNEFRDDDTHRQTYSGKDNILCGGVVTDLAWRSAI